MRVFLVVFFFFQAEDGIRDGHVTGVQTCALPISLVNRLFGSREAIAHEMPGVTRDRVELEATWGGRTLKLIDTGGFAHDAKGIEALVSDQAERAAREAEVVLLVVDVQTGH